MRPLLIATLFLSLTAAAQTSEVPITAEPSHHLVLENEHARVFKVEVPPHAQTLIHRHDHDYVFVTLGDSEIENTVTGKAPIQLKLKDGEARFLMGNFSHAARNLSDQPFRNITVELLKDNTHAQLSNFDPPPSPAQKVLFTQDGVRVCEIRLPPGASLPHHDHKFPHLVVALSDYDLRSDPDGKPSVAVHQKTGDTRWIPAGLAHTLTNTGKTEAHLITLEFQ